MDFAGLVPVVGEVADIGKALRGLGQATDALDTVSDTARASNQLMDGLTDAQRAGQALAALGDGSQAAEAGIDLSRAALRERQKAELLEAIASQMDDGIMKRDNTSVRTWYYQEVLTIPEHIDPSLPLESRAHIA